MSHCGHSISPSGSGDTFLSREPRHRSSFQFIGGWHITRERPAINKRADHLCIMGDMGRPASPLFRELLEDAAEKFKRVFVLAGRCEYGGRLGMEDTDLMLERLCQGYGNMHYLQRSSVMVRGDLIVAGSTLRLWPSDPRYADSLPHLVDELGGKRRADGRKALYLSYGLPERRHLCHIRELAGQRMLVSANEDRDPPDGIVHM
jgi:hypothetical protein